MASPQTLHRSTQAGPSASLPIHLPRVSPRVAFAHCLKQAYEEGQMLNSGRNVFTGSRGTMPNASCENTHMDFGMIAHKPTTTRGGEKENLKRCSRQAHNGDLFWSCDFKMGVRRVFESLRLISGPLSSNSVYLTVSTTGLIGD